MNKLLVTCLLIPLACASCSGLGSLLNTSTLNTELSTEQEDLLGREVAAEMLDSNPLAGKNSFDRYLNTIGNALTLFSDRPETFAGYSFALVQGSELNSFSAPGGYVFITAGFVKHITDEDVLAALLAHEIAHVVRRHALAQDDGSVLQIADTLKMRGFMPEHEFEADREAAGILKRAGYSPQALLTLLTIVERQDEQGCSGWCMTHPTPAERRSKLQALLGSTPSAVNAGYNQRRARFLHFVSK